MRLSFIQKPYVKIPTTIYNIFVIINIFISQPISKARYTLLPEPTTVGGFSGLNLLILFKKPNKLLYIRFKNITAAACISDVLF